MHNQMVKTVATDIQSALRSGVQADKARPTHAVAWRHTRACARTISSSPRADIGRRRIACGRRARVERKRHRTHLAGTKLENKK